MSQITTHVLDTAAGCPAAGIAVTLFHEDSGAGALASGTTNADGRVPGLLPEGQVLAAGTYRMHFATEPYLARDNQPAFYPHVDVVFCLDGSGEHYHIPLLLSPFGYSTYRGS